MAKGNVSAFRTACLGLSSHVVLQHVIPGPPKAVPLSREPAEALMTANRIIEEARTRQTSYHSAEAGE